jgi:pre-rRNA-processing protein TSR3
MAFYEFIIDHGETANKCTIAPLIGRPDFHVTRVGRKSTLGPLKAKILLHHEGECLSTLREKYTISDGLACVDSIWRRLPRLIEMIERPLPLLAKIPNGFVTAYPRKSRLYEDPDGGLATIEAVFIAAAMLGHWDETLLSEYYFSQSFIEANLARFADFGIQRGLPLAAPGQARARNAWQRRIDRGRMGKLRRQAFGAD